ncbi:MAG TPA: MBOAT family protein, partial [Candidatus Sericytochromatia bacterium]
SLGWLLFKLPDFGQVLDFLRTMKHNFKLPINQALTNPVLIFSLPVVVYHLLHLPALSGDKIDKFKKSENQVYNLFKDIVLGGMLVMIILNSGSPNEFIYFQF